MRRIPRHLNLHQTTATGSNLAQAEISTFELPVPDRIQLWEQFPFYHFPSPSVIHSQLVYAVSVALTKRYWNTGYENAKEWLSIFCLPQKRQRQFGSTLYFHQWGREPWVFWFVSTSFSFKSSQPTKTAVEIKSHGGRQPLVLRINSCLYRGT